ncbi:hypothetical protein GW17_00035067 [Ensete ventricosum]|nr:hypothetical protein GW17_00035067 [Ensete ventricosum]
MRHSLASREKRGDASSRRKTRCCLVPEPEEEATPRLPANERGVASSSRGKTRQCLALVPARKDEATPCPRPLAPLALPYRKTRRRLVSPTRRGDTLFLVYNFDIYRLVRAVHTNPPGCRYADRAIPPKIDRQRSISAVSSRLREKSGRRGKDKKEEKKT